MAVPLSKASLASLVEAARRSVQPWWAARSPRERLLLVALASLAAALIVVQLMIRPLFEARRNAADELAAVEQLVLRLRSAPPVPAGRPPVRQSGTPREIAAAASAAAGLTPELTDEAGGVRARLVDAPFAAAARWIADVDRSASVQATDVRFARGAADGLADAEVVFQP